MILLLAIILTIVLALWLPAEIAYNFKIDAPDQLTSRSVFLTWTLLPQFFLTLLAVIIVGGVLWLSRHFTKGESALPVRLLTIMGNMVALPQLVLLFTMLDVFLYNAYEVHIMPLWLFAVIIMLAGMIILGVLFFQAVQARQKA